MSVYPDDLKTKVYLLKHFERYIMDRLYGDYEYTFEDTARAKGMDFVQKYLRMKHVIVFKMSHDVLQVRSLFFSIFLPRPLLKLYLNSSISTTTQKLFSLPTDYWLPTSIRTTR